jgi:hypothetical protein
MTRDASMKLVAVKEVLFTHVLSPVSVAIPFGGGRHLRDTRACALLGSIR